MQARRACLGHAYPADDERLSVETEAARLTASLSDLTRVRM